MKERQKTLNNTDDECWYDLSKEDKLKQLYEKLNYDKIITYFGNINSKVVILGIAPMSAHVESDSKSVFAFDKDLKQTTHSGGVLCKVFKELNLNIEDFFWDNIFKIPVEKLTEEDKKIFREKIDDELIILEPSVIICLGNDSYQELKRAYVNVNVEIHKIFHPAAILRGLLPINTYIEQWKEILNEEINNFAGDKHK